jgi:hypothetical protein
MGAAARREQDLADGLTVSQQAVCLGGIGQEDGRSASVVA